jgi:hypothetical protein
MQMQTPDQSDKVGDYGVQWNRNENAADRRKNQKFDHRLNDLSDLARNLRRVNERNEKTYR